MFNKITTNLMVGDVNETLDFYEKVLGFHLVTIVEDLHTTFYGVQEFYVRDGNGYVLTFASR